ncbi:MAG TPA: sulfatase-like hydrolase/transferase [Micromonosporaceae bacterium]|nr:sulfatase-like hydrolase/transferase [Micromonosporaceae bacterium]
MADSDQPESSPESMGEAAATSPPASDETAVTDPAGEAAVADPLSVDETAVTDETAVSDELAQPAGSLTAVDEPSIPVDDPAAWRRTERRALLEILALCGLVIVQPVLDIAGRSPDFFLYHGAGSLDILLLVAGLTLVPPLLLWGIGGLARLAGPRIRTVTHELTVGALLVALAVQVGKHLFPLRGAPLAVLAVAAAAVGLYAYRRWRTSKQLLRVASVGPLVFVLLFVFASPSSALVLPSGSLKAGAGAAPGATHPPVVLLVLDELPLVSLLGPDGMIDERRFPNFARLAGQSTWYRNATTVSGSTPYALPAILTGNYPEGKEAPHYSRYPDNLFTLLSGVYDLHVRESITQLCPPARCGTTDPPPRGGLAALFRESVALLGQVLSPGEVRQAPESSYREPTRREAGADAEPTPGPEDPTDPQFRWSALNDNQPSRFSEFLAELRPAGRPALHFLHLLMPHTPWTYLPSGMRYPEPEGLVNDGDGWVSLAYERHLAQLDYTDRLIGETLRRLTETGLYDEALLVVTADHGVSFTPGAQGRQAHQASQAPGEVLWVPMFVKEPRQRTGRVDDRNWEQVDLLPTIAAQVNLPVSWRTDGVPATEGPRERTEKHYYDQPGDQVIFPGPRILAEVISGAARPAVPTVLPELVGRATDELPVTNGGLVTVSNRSEFNDVDPAGGQVPALVLGSVPAAVPVGTPLAVALNGRIAAVVPVGEADSAGRRFGGLIRDDSLFRPGANRLEVFEVATGGVLRRLRG